MTGPNYSAQAAQHGSSYNPQSYSADDLQKKSWWQNFKDKYVMTPEQMETTYNNKESDYYKQNIEPKVELSKAMANGMDKPLGQGQEVIANKISGADLDGLEQQTAGIGGNETETTAGGNTSSNSGGGGSDTIESETEEMTETNPKETKRYTDSMMGIWDAFREGKIDQGTALYFTLDSISKLARNTGKDLANIAAAFTGGTIDNEREDSLWNQRRDAMFENELAGEVESEYGTPAWRKKEHDLNSLSMEDKNLFTKDIENWILNNSKGLTIDALGEQLRAMGISNDVAEASSWLQRDLVEKAKNGNKSAQTTLTILSGLNAAGNGVGTAVGSAAKALQ